MVILDQYTQYKDDRLSQFVLSGRRPWQSVLLRQVLRHVDQGSIPCLPFRYIGEQRIQTDRWVGKFSVGGQHYLIAPLLGDGLFWSMALVAVGLPGVEALQAGGGFDPGTLGRHILALLWTSALDQARRAHGVTKGYVHRREPHEPALRGQLDLHRQLTENELGARHRIACIFEDLTTDNPVNRGILATIRRLRHEGLFPFWKVTGSNPRREALLDWEDRLVSLGVQESTSIMPLHGIRWTRANSAFRRAHELAERLAHDRGAETATSGLDEALFFDTAEVWEVFLWERLQRVTGRMDGLRVRSPRLQNGAFDYLLRYKGFNLRGLLPDYFLERWNSTTHEWKRIAILDAKCRNLDWRGSHFLPDDETVTQMALYSCNTETDSSLPCALLYPKAQPMKGARGMKDTPGMNYTIPGSPAPVGESRLEVTDKPNLSWWVINLPRIQPKDKTLQNWETVDRELKCILQHLERLAS